MELELQFVDCRMVSVLAWFCLSLFFKWVCQTFFISLSVRPGNFAAIADHLRINQGEKKKSLMVFMANREEKNLKQIEINN